ncbi:MAG: hypothetical protein CVT92_10280 [Bacteroidetes bacterium HGW-Bacteroidetes-1]|jgi:hypothetical protein|nr:MAG: hypothetical protein CVT92_10280 [Bacteroidetes bacterium HGW-Bacteroidetes-1]
MDDTSIFPDKATKPTDKDLAGKLGSAYALWIKIHDIVLSKYPGGLSEWNYPGNKYGWKYRIKDKKRAIIYLLPRDLYFKVAFVFGDKAVNKIMDSKISNDIKNELNQATKYAEGRGIRIDVKNDSAIVDIEQLIDIKLSN